MRLALKTLTVYLRLLVVLLVVGAIGLILFQNRSYKVNVWLFGLTDASRPVNVVWVMLATALCTLVATWLFWLGRGLVRDFREVRVERERMRKEKLQGDKVAQLDERQRRVEEQLRRVAGDPAKKPEGHNVEEDVEGDL